MTVVDVAEDSCHEATASPILEITDDEAVTDEVTKAANECLDLQNDDVEFSNVVATLEECDVVMPSVSAVSLTAMTTIDDVIESGEDCIITEGTKERVDHGWKYVELEKNSNAAVDEVFGEVLYEVDDEVNDVSIVSLFSDIVYAMVDSNVDLIFDKDE